MGEPPVWGEDVSTTPCQELPGPHLRRSFSGAVYHLAGSKLGLQGQQSITFADLPWLSMGFLGFAEKKTGNFPVVILEFRRAMLPDIIKLKDHDQWIWRDKITGHPHISWENRWFPVDFPWSPPLTWKIIPCLPASRQLRPPSGTMRTRNGCDEESVRLRLGILWKQQNQLELLYAQTTSTTFEINWSLLDLFHLKPDWYSTSLVVLPGILHICTCLDTMEETNQRLWRKTLKNQHVPANKTKPYQTISKCWRKGQHPLFRTLLRRCPCPNTVCHHSYESWV